MSELTVRSEYLVQVRKVHASGDLRGQPLTYRYATPLETGDRVVCPSSEWTAAFIAEVVQVGSDYAGRVRSLLCRVAPDRPLP